MITHEADAFRANCFSYRIAEPLVTFYHAVMRPNWGALERPGRAAAVWQRAQPTFLSKVVGPHFEELARQWARWHASPDTHGGHPTLVASGTVNDPANRTTHDVGIAVLDGPGNGRRCILSIGEAKWNTTMTLGHLERLRHIRDLLTEHPTTPATEHTRLALYGATGFTPDLHRTADRDEVTSSTCTASTTEYEEALIHLAVALSR